MGGGDSGPNPDDLAQRGKALEREYRELRDALINGAPDGELDAGRKKQLAPTFSSTASLAAVTATASV